MIYLLAILIFMAVIFIVGVWVGVPYLMYRNAQKKMSAALEESAERARMENG